eukprot:3812364-Pleurochrysis_carterae.AAC.3
MQAPQGICRFCHGEMKKGHVCPIAWAPHLAFCKSQQGGFHLGQGGGLMLPAEFNGSGGGQLMFQQHVHGAIHPMHMDEKHAAQLSQQQLPMAVAHVARYADPPSHFVPHNMPGAYAPSADSSDEAELMHMGHMGQEGNNKKFVNSIVQGINPYQSGMHMHSFNDAYSSGAIRPEKVRRQWSPAEDQMLADAVARYGDQRWSYIAHLVPGRMGKQCRERWINHLRYAQCYSLHGLRNWYPHVASSYMLLSI